MYYLCAKYYKPITVQCYIAYGEVGKNGSHYLQCFVYTSPLHMNKFCSEAVFISPVCL